MVKSAEVYAFASSDIKARKASMGADEDESRSIIMDNALLKNRHLLALRIQETADLFHVFCLCLSDKNPNGKPHDMKTDIQKTVTTSTRY